MEITREELNNLIDLRIEERRANKNAFTEILNGFEEELRNFDYEKQRLMHTCDGRTINYVDTFNNAYKVRSALSTLVKAHFKVKNASNIASENKKEVKEFVKKIICIALPDESK